MTAPASNEPRISQRDLRSRSREIMDALEAGESYAVTRDGRVIGHLVPEQGPRTFVSRSLFADLFSAPGPDLELFRRHTRDHLSDDVIDPYERS